MNASRTRGTFHAVNLGGIRLLKNTSPILGHEWILLSCQWFDPLSRHPVLGTKKVDKFRTQHNICTGMNLRTAVKIVSCLPDWLIETLHSERWRSRSHQSNDRPPPMRQECASRTVKQDEKLSKKLFVKPFSETYTHQRSVVDITVVLTFLRNGQNS